MGPNWQGEIKWAKYRVLNWGFKKNQLWSTALNSSFCGQDVEQNTRREIKVTKWSEILYYLAYI